MRYSGEYEYILNDNNNISNIHIYSDILKSVIW